VAIPTKQDPPEEGLPISPNDIETMDSDSLRRLRRALDLEAYKRNLQAANKEQGMPNDTLEALFTRRREEANLLLASIQTKQAELRALLDEMSGEWTYCDRIYRFYHQSFKVYWLQSHTLQIRDALQDLMPGRPMNGLLVRIIEAGTGHEFQMEHNRDWIVHTLPITTAFFHARFFLEMAVRCLRFEQMENNGLDSDLAALLYLFNLR